MSTLLSIITENLAKHLKIWRPWHLDTQGDVGDVALVEIIADTLEVVVS